MIHGSDFDFDNESGSHSHCRSLSIILFIEVRRTSCSIYSICLKFCLCCHNVIVTRSNRTVVFFNHNGEQQESFILLPGNCTWMEWDKDGENLAIAQNGNGEVVLYKPVKKFQMKSNGCRDVQAYKAHKQGGTLVSKVHKQGTLTRHMFPSIPTSVAALEEQQNIFSTLKALAYPT